MDVQSVARRLVKCNRRRGLQKCRKVPAYSFHYWVPSLLVLERAFRLAWVKENRKGTRIPHVIQPPWGKLSQARAYHAQTCIRLAAAVPSIPLPRHAAPIYFFPPSFAPALSPSPTSRSFLQPCPRCPSPLPPACISPVHFCRIQSPCWPYRIRGRATTWEGRWKAGQQLRTRC